MTGDDLIEVAGRLIANPHAGDAEARYRSAVSRAYFGVFHWAIRVLDGFGIIVPGNAESHNVVYWKLLDTNNGTAREAAHVLGDLRTERNRADYRLDDSKYSNQRNAQLCLQDASDAVSRLKLCLQEPLRTELKDSFKS